MDININKYIYYTYIYKHICAEINIIDERYYQQ